MSWRRKDEGCSSVGGSNPQARAACGVSLVSVNRRALCLFIDGDYNADKQLYVATLGRWVVRIVG